MVAAHTNPLSLTVDASRIRALDTPYRLLEGSRLSAELRQRLSQPQALRTVGCRLADLATRLHVESLAGASDSGSRLAVAAVLHADTDLHLYEPGDQMVLIVEGVAVTGVRIERCASKLRADGATNLYVATMYDLREKAYSLETYRFGGDIIDH